MLDEKMKNDDNVKDFLQVSDSIGLESLVSSTRVTQHITAKEREKNSSNRWSYFPFPEMSRFTLQ